MEFAGAQEVPPILSVDKPRSGIYLDFNEFITNAPSIQSPFQLICKSGEYKIDRGTADYKLILLDSMNKRREIKKFWGVSDGETIYVNEVIYGGPLNFKKIHGLGRYCYFKGTLNNSSAAVSAGVMGGALGGGLAAAAMEIDGDYPYILNINNGKCFLLDKKTLKTVLAKDEALLAEYEDAERKSKRDTLLSYIIRYNERNQDEIKHYRPEPYDITFYRRQKKERIGAITVTAGDTIQFALDPNSTKRITWLNASLDVCIEGNCKTILLEKKKINFIECSWKSEQPEFAKVKIDVGSFYVKEIVYSEKKIRSRSSHCGEVAPSSDMSPSAEVKTTFHYTLENI